jgi:hypothetical protein
MGQLGNIANPQFFLDMRHVMTDCLWADIQDAGNLID